MGTLWVVLGALMRHLSKADHLRVSSSGLCFLTRIPPCPRSGRWTVSGGREEGRGRQEAGDGIGLPFSYWTERCQLAHPY